MLRASLVVDHKLREYVCSIENIKSKKAHTGRLEHPDLSKEKIENSLLNLMLGDGAFPPALKMTQVQLQPGPMADLCRAEAWAYFPVDALITVGPEHPAQAAVALVGRHGGVLGPQVGHGAVHAHVMTPGLAYRVDWAVVRDDPTRYAQWLWHAAAATQALLNQMAQWSFCVQHHTPAQRLASWFLHCMAQSPAAPLQLNLQLIPPSIRQGVVGSPVDAFHVQPLSGFEVREGFLSAAAPQRLSALACTCHQKLAAR
jgi:hypothetical protein